MDRFIFVKTRSKPQENMKDSLSNYSEDRSEPESPEEVTLVTENTETEEAGNESSTESSNEIILNSVENRKSRKKNYKQKYRDAWKSIYGDWLITKEDKRSYCKCCNLHLEGGYTHIARHSKTLKHRNKYKASKMSLKIEDVVESSPELKITQQVKSSEILLILLLAEHNLPFLLLDHLCKILPALCPDSEVAKRIKLNRKKGTSLCKQVIAQEQLSLVVKYLNENFYSIIMDETTDISTTKCLAMVVRYFDGKKICDKFLGLIKVENSTAEGLFMAVTNFLNEKKISTKKLMGFAGDNCNVMMGNKSGVQAKFKVLVPHIFILGCVCHSFSLCSSAACAKLPKSLEELVRDICSYFSVSSQRIKNLEECQIFVNLKPHKMLKLAQTRWLSLQAVIERILEQYNALILFFTNETFDKSLVRKPDHILNALKNPIFKLYFFFLDYILNIVNKLNLEFQSASLKLHILQDRISALFRTIVRNFMKREHIDNVKDMNEIQINNPHCYLLLEKIYLGAKFEKYLLEIVIEEGDLENIRICCLQFYIELCSQIKSRFSFNDPVFSLLHALNPKYVYSEEVPSLVPIIHRFPILCHDNNIEELDQEWRLLQDTQSLKQHCHEDALDFWKMVFSLKNDLDNPMFPNLKIVISGLLCLPHSSATAERIFSQLNLIKTKNRNCLLTETCDALLHTKGILDDNNCFSFKPSLSLLRRKITDQNETTEVDLMF